MTLVETEVLVGDAVDVLLCSKLVGEEIDDCRVEDWAEFVEEARELLLRVDCEVGDCIVVLSEVPLLVVLGNTVVELVGTFWMRKIGRGQVLGSS